MFKNGKRTVKKPEGVNDPLTHHMLSTNDRELEAERKEAKARNREVRAARAAAKAQGGTASSPVPAPVPPAVGRQAGQGVPAPAPVAKAVPAPPMPLTGWRGGSSGAVVPSALPTSPVVSPVPVVLSGVEAPKAVAEEKPKAVTAPKKEVKIKPVDKLENYNKFVQRYIKEKQYAALDTYGSMWGTRAMHQDPTGVLLAKSIVPLIRNQRLEERNYVSIINQIVIELEFTDHDPYDMEIRDEEYL